MRCFRNFNSINDKKPILRLTGTLTLDQAAEIATGQCIPQITNDTADRIVRGHDRLKQCIAEGHTIYGITTGFGPLANRQIKAQDANRLQENLIAHLASGTGKNMRWEQARAMLVARLNSLLQGVSGASLNTVQLLVDILASPYAPAVPEMGTVGASGDLTPLAHAALALMGRGAFLHADGSSVPSTEVFRHIGKRPLQLTARDGLALVNGTSAMTGTAVLNSRAIQRRWTWGIALSAGVGELLRARSEAWDQCISDVRPHPGQVRAATALRERVEGSTRLIEKGRLETKSADVKLEPKFRTPQDPYTLRCVPQVLGAVADIADFHDKILRVELNSATDNPIFSNPIGQNKPQIYHGGNFMGQHVAFASDALTNAIVMTAALAERQLARLTDETLNGDLSAFLNRGSPGLNSGFMGAQVTATALLAEMRTRAIPASIQTISTNASNQDIVSMGTIAARSADWHIWSCTQIQAILALAIAQGVDIVDEKENHASISCNLRGLQAQIRALVPPMHFDRPLSTEIETIASEIEFRDPYSSN